MSKLTAQTLCDLIIGAVEFDEEGAAAIVGFDLLSEDPNDVLVVVYVDDGRAFRLALTEIPA